MSITYKDSGVDVEAGYKSVELMKESVKSTYNKNVIGDFGSFGGLFSIAEYKELAHPVLVAGTDGVGTKLKFAFAINKHDTIGQDLVAMCVNDIVCLGAKPLFFLDYIAQDKIHPDKVADIVAGIAKACKLSNMALLGGETAEMPGFYAKGEYDLAGFAVGIVDKNKIIDGTGISDGDSLIGIASSGFHSNGYSLIRKVVGESETALNAYCNRMKRTWAEELLTPTKIYVNTILELVKHHRIKGIANITGGGVIENLPRILPKGIGAEIYLSAYPKRVSFENIVALADLTPLQAHNTFNMGIGMILCVKKAEEQAIINHLNALGEQAWVVGRVIISANPITLV